MTPVVVRPARPADAPALADIHVAGYEEAYRGLVPDAVIDARGPDVRRRRWSARLAEHRPREFVLVAELEGEVRGFVSGREAATGEVEQVDPRVGCWENLYSSPELVGDARGFRVALALHEALEAAFRERAYREAVAFVVEGNERARRFFELLGWRADGAVRVVEGTTQHRVRRTFEPPAPVGRAMDDAARQERRR